jgi:hypothetical protein
LPPLDDRGRYPEATGSELLDIAQITLTEALLPYIEPNQRSLALMVASAMRMVAREIEQRSALDEMRARLTAIADPSGDTEGEHLLVAAIRGGHLDGDSSLHMGLWEDAVVRVSVARPSMLTRVERRMAGLSDEAVSAEQA